MSTEQKNTWTIGKVLGAAKDYLERHGSQSPRLEAEQLMAFVLKMGRVDLYVQYDRPLSVQEREAYKNKMRERSQGAPIQYITGSQGFRRLVLNVTPDVLIPRPETELLVDSVIEKLKLKGAAVALPAQDKKQSNGKFFDILDIGTGSGAIAISLAYELLNVRLWALDISTGALAVAIKNADRYHVRDRITFFQSDLFSRLRDQYQEKFDVIVANPPYIAQTEMAGLPEDVRHEPNIALYGGTSGLDFYRRIGSEAKTYLKKNGFLALEIAADKAAEVTGILQLGLFSDIRCIKDYAGRDRVLLAWWNG